MKRLLIALALICFIALPLFASAATTWEIVRADYGSGNKRMDVTERVRSLVQGDSLNFRVSGHTLGADQRRGRNRVLRLRVKDNQGRSRLLTYRDGQQVNLPIYAAYTNNSQNNLQISRATYGSGSRSYDVTTRLSSQIQSNQLNLQVNNDTMGGDPDPGQPKALTVFYSLNGQNSQSTVREGEMLRLPLNTTSQNGLQIVRASYGSAYRTNDVTNRLSSRVRDNQLSMQINSNNMGGDPDPGQPKALTVMYSLNGQNSQSTVREGEMLRLPLNTTSQNGLQIVRASYGSAYRTNDVTDRLSSRVRDNQLNMQVNSYNMGGDPDPGQAKTLTVEYLMNGQNGQSVARDGENLHVPYNYNKNTTSGLLQRMRCESSSSDWGRKYCTADTRNGVRLTRNLGDSDCREGSTWGYDNNGVWVSNGCRAEFETRGPGQNTGSLAATTIPSGTELSVRTNELIESKTASVGQSYSATMAADVVDSTGSVRIPKGADVRLVIRSASGGNITSASDLVLDVDSLTVSGTRYQVSTGDLDQHGGSGVGANKKTAIMVGGGAALGTLIGAIVGGGKGAAIGAAVGAGAGVGTQVLTKGSQVTVPAETLLNFKLDQDLRLQAIR